MSWDIIVHRFPQDIETIEQLPDDFTPSAIGSRAEVAQAIQKVFPSANISDLGWLVIDGEDFRLKSVPAERSRATVLCFTSAEATQHWVR
jgi:hypothetical protein